MSQSKLAIDVSIVSGSNETLLLECLRSLLEYGGGDHYTLNVTVTCNTPGSNLPTKIRQAFSGVGIIENQSRKGFAANHNVVLQNTTADYILILNDDLVFLPGAVQQMVDFMEHPENHRVAMLSPRLLNPDRTLQPSTYSFPSVLRAFFSVSGLRELIPFSATAFKLARWIKVDSGKSRFWAHDRTMDVDTFRGACMLGRATAIREVGPMLTETIVGGEEVEWHYRFHQRGWRVVFYHEPQVIHYGNQTVKTDPALQNEYLKAYLVFFGCHRPRLTFYTFSLLALGALIVRWAWCIMTRRQSQARLELQGIRLIGEWLRARPLALEACS